MNFKMRWQTRSTRETSGLLQHLWSQWQKCCLQLLLFSWWQI